MGDDEETLARLWREKRGEAEPEDLSSNLIVQLGVVTEPLSSKRNSCCHVTEEGAVEKYRPQLQHNMWITNAKQAVLSIITGGGKWVEISISADPPLPASPADGGEEVLALCRER
jgi:hypothetical protein